jgi:hypothetical protein
VKKHWLPWILLAILTSLNVHAETVFEKKEKYNRIYNACLLDKSASVDMQVRAIGCHYCYRQLTQK